MTSFLSSFFSTTIPQLVQTYHQIIQFLSTLQLQTVIQYIQTIYESCKTYILDTELDEDAKLSLKIGLTAGVGIVGYLMAYPGEPFDYTLIDGGRGDKNAEDTPTSEPPSADGDRKKGGKKGKKDNKKKDVNLIAAEANPPSKDGAKGPLSLEMETSDIMKKTSKVQKMFGLSDSQMRQAVENAKLESLGESINLNRVGSGPSDGSMSLSQKVDVFVYMSLFGALVYFSMRDGGGSVKRFLLTYFPKEARAMGIKQNEGEVQWRMN
ncbi:hypothetical protein TrCOL_g10371 [Triparma columacea]|uniref:Uncharacterized protein n=1 Tax=Triparma columacea TaxID=722753 RepID=A0A9W7FZH6_9STRA|nr:hypothetical protein TrCOL_g10371 [Triparma columacea]